MKRPIISIVITCLNEKYTIKRSVTDAVTNGQKYFPRSFEVIVADNGSTDGTLQIIKSLRSCRVVHVPVRGYGAALHWGILNARAAFVLFADADLSYPFSNLKSFQSIIEKRPDLVLGSRFQGSIQKGAMPFLHRYLGTPVLTTLIRAIYAISTTDCNSGMRLVRKSFYQQLNMRNSGMEWASELLLKTAIKKGSYLEVPITFLKDKRGRHPHLSTWADGWRHLKTIILLKPSCLYLPLVAMPILGSVIMPFSFAISFLFFLSTFVLLLSLLTFELLRAAIEKLHSPVSSFLNRFTLVPLTALVTLLIGLFIYFVPDSHLGSKLFLSSLISIVFMWILLIETIKTHLL
ncbi:MAG: glycosyltransferase family 2 protein, partial [Microgenomates group bacterium]